MEIGRVECIPVVADAPAVTAIPPSQVVRAGKVDETVFRIWLDINAMVDCPSGWQFVGELFRKTAFMLVEQLLNFRALLSVYPYLVSSCLQLS